MTDASHVLHLAGCLIQDEEGRALLLHRNTSAHNHWECPGGKKRPGESDAVAAAREVREELNVDVLLTRCLGTRTFTDSVGEMTYTWYQARIASGVPEVRELHIHDAFDYFDVTQLASMKEQLSSGMQVLVEEIAAGRVVW
jgi:8-oxo-dGTP diphosphatase